MAGLFSDNIIFDPTYNNMERAVKEAQLQSAVHSYNLANAAVPGFKPVQFYEELAIAKDKKAKKEEWLTPKEPRDPAYTKVDVQREIQALRDLAFRQKSLLRLMKIKESIEINIVRQGK
jgi:flagellar basal body rod protein FlgF